ncbi:DUF6233 domain-containing protein [Streptomyces anulatus]|uniref:DUF6233 domain-containing protein n=1 Tax=Streptomyces anulatus TaxID=1892 RepID=UPI0033DDADE7
MRTEARDLESNTCPAFRLACLPAHRARVAAAARANRSHYRQAAAARGCGCPSSHRQGPCGSSQCLHAGGDTRANAVHTGDCDIDGKRTQAMTREQALRALTDGITACLYHRPDMDLGAF